MQYRVLIVGTVPYNEKSTSRAFDAYFHYMDKKNLAQIFSNTKTPCKGHCETLFQITDHRIMKRWLDKKEKTGRIFRYDDLPKSWNTSDLELNDRHAEKAYKIGRKHTALTHLLRGLLWRKKFWCTNELNSWLDDFSPECVFLAFSDDYFIPEIACYVAEKYNIPIVSCIGDDYYFNDHFSLNPIYVLYKKTYKKLIRRVFKHKGSAIYISDKIRDKYNSVFGLNGKTVYLTSTIERAPFKVADTESPLITYFGNIRMGRNRSLCDIADALALINPTYKLTVYSNEIDAAYTKILKLNEHIEYRGSIPYSQVKEQMQRSDITVIVEGFEKKDIDKSRYSLSTKAADALASGVLILAYGDADCGIIEYMKHTRAAVVCDNKQELGSMIRGILADDIQQKAYYDRQIVVTADHHSLRKSCEIAESVIENAVEGKNAK